MNVVRHYQCLRSGVVGLAVLVGLGWGRDVSAANYRVGYESPAGAAFSNATDVPSPVVAIVLDLGVGLEPVSVNNQGTVLLRNSSVVALERYTRVKTTFAEVAGREILSPSLGYNSLAPKGINNLGTAWGVIGYNGVWQAAYWNPGSLAAQSWFNHPIITSARVQTSEVDFMNDLGEIWGYRTDLDRVANTFEWASFTATRPGLSDGDYAFVRREGNDERQWLPGTEIVTYDVSPGGEMMADAYDVSVDPLTGYQTWTYRRSFAGPNATETVEVPFGPWFNFFPRLNSRGYGLVPLRQPTGRSELFLWDAVEPNRLRHLGDLEGFFDTEIGSNPGQGGHGINDPQDPDERLMVINSDDLWVQTHGTGEATVELAKYSLSAMLPTGGAFKEFSAWRISDDGNVILGTARHRNTNARHAVMLRLNWNVGLAVDANRDGDISPAGLNSPDLATEKAPFRFWSNDDDDVDTNDPDDSEKAPIEAADWTDNKIDGIRDLEDFARLSIHFGGLHEAILNGTMKIGLKWKNVTSGAPSVKIWRNLSPNGGTEYLYDEAIAAQHLFLTAPGHVQDTTPYFIPQTFWQHSGFSATNPYGYLLFEGCTEGKGELAITINKADGTEIGEGPGVWLDLKNIKQMYQRVKALADGGDEIPKPPDFTGPDDNNIPNPVMSWTEDPNGYPFEAPAGETKTCIVSVHGWNQTYERSTMYAESAFKRLWHRGYRGRFVRFRWPTYVGLLTYNNSEYKAWKCGESLQQYLDSIPRGSGGFTVNMIAHSMGNIVAGEALRRGASVANYGLWNAAVPSICYDDRAALDQGWGYTHPNDDPDAYTRTLAYRDRFAGVGGRLINFFLEGDSALLAWRANNATSKPERWTSGFIAGYGYDRNEISGRKLYLEFWTAFGRFMVDPYEAMSYAVTSPTLAVGADSDLVDSGGASYGSISAEIDMGAAYSFGSAHSAEFLFPIQKTKALYDQTLIEFGLSPLP